jgi:hypothetical protein
LYTAGISTTLYFYRILPLKISKLSTGDISKSTYTFNMGQPSTQASNAVIYLSYGAFLYASTTRFEELSGFFAIRRAESFG